MTTTKCKNISPRTNQINLKSFPLLLSAIYHRLKVWPALGFGWCDRRSHSSETTSSLIFALGQAIIANLSRQALLPPVCPVLQFKSNINFLYFTNSRTAVHSRELDKLLVLQVQYNPNSPLLGQPSCQGSLIVIVIVCLYWSSTSRYLDRNNDKCLWLLLLFSKWTSYRKGRTSQSHTNELIY